jgi:hypothetical protein
MCVDEGFHDIDVVLLDGEFHRVAGFEACWPGAVAFEGGCQEGDGGGVPILGGSEDGAFEIVTFDCGDCSFVVGVFGGTHLGADVFLPLQGDLDPMRVLKQSLELRVVSF